MEGDVIDMITDKEVDWTLGCYNRRVTRSAAYIASRAGELQS